MTTPLVTGSVPLFDLEQELTRQANRLKGPGEAPALWARMSNLVVFCDRAGLAEGVSAAVPDIVALHPARVLLLACEPEAEPAELTASVGVWRQPGGGQQICSEQVTLHARGHAAERLPFAVRRLLIGDLPTNLWWAAKQPPPLAGPLLYDLAEPAQQVIYDSLGWAEPAAGVAAVADWLHQFGRAPLAALSPGETSKAEGRWRVASDLNWRRLKYWRRLLSQALDPASAPGALESITEVLVEHGPHAVVQAWELVSWLAARLGWQVQAGRVQPGVEIAWQARAPQGAVRLRVRRLADGPPEVRRVRLACAPGGKPGALNVAVEDESRLAVSLEGGDAAPRTVTVQPQSLAELVGRQLSDRERDPVFFESMAVAQVLAQSVLAR